MFSLARRLSPCVVFIDELDALFGARLSRESGNSLAHRGVITEFMQEMDGLKTNKESNVIVIGATNRPFARDDVLLCRLPRRLLSRFYFAMTRLPSMLTSSCWQRRPKVFPDLT